jgi:hypothetical protein
VERGPRAGRPFHVLRDGRLGNGLDLGVDSSPRRDGWVRFDTDAGYMEVDYAAGTAWGAVTFLLGLDDPAHRLTEDFSAFSAVEIVAAGHWGYPQPQTCGWSGSGLGFTMIGVSDSPVAGDPCNPDAPPSFDVRGQECWLAPPAGDASRTYRIPLTYLEAGQPLRRKLWSPAKLVLPDSTAGGAYSLQISQISLLPQSAPVDASAELCPVDCLCLTPGCELACGRTDAP